MFKPWVALLPHYLGIIVDMMLNTADIKGCMPDLVMPVCMFATRHLLMTKCRIEKNAASITLCQAV